tara:strand:- start:25 stop:729 length:705 start_codon:yes stop_codon:yes gene_type:complete
MPQKTPSVQNLIVGTVSPTFAGARDATSGTVFTGGGGGSPTTHPEAIKYSKVASGRGNQISINRYFLEFDTSDISVTPADATLSIYGDTNTSADFFAVKATFSDGSLANGDFDAIDGWSAGADNSSNVTKYSSEVTSWSTGAYNNITLTSDALSDMASVDNFKICLIQSDNDLANVEATAVVTTGLQITNQIRLAYTEGSSGYTNNVLGVASANIAGVNGVATANIASVNGVDT